MVISQYQKPREPKTPLVYESKLILFYMQYSDGFSW